MLMSTRRGLPWRDRESKVRVTACKVKACMRLSKCLHQLYLIKSFLCYANLHTRDLQNNGCSEVSGTYQLFWSMSSDIGDIAICSPESLNGSSLWEPHGSYRRAGQAWVATSIWKNRPHAPWRILLWEQWTFLLAFVSDGLWRDYSFRTGQESVHRCLRTSLRPLHHDGEAGWTQMALWCWVWIRIPAPSFSWNI